MSTSVRNKAKEKHIQSKLNLKKTGKTASPVDGGNDDASIQHQASSADIDDNTEEPSVQQQTLANILAAIGKIDVDMNSRFNTLDSALHQVQASLVDHTTCITDLEGRATDHESCITGLEQRCTELMEVNKSTKRKLIDREGRSRCSNIKITGLQERMENGNPTQFVTELLPQLLWTNNFPDGLRVDRAHRIGPPASGHPRIIIGKNP